MTTNVTVVVPVFNHADALSRCIPALLEQDLAKDRYEIVIVDDGSTDHLESVISIYKDVENIRFVHQENRGPGAARNLGFTRARYPLIAFTDADCVPDTRWLSEIVRNVERLRLDYPNLAAVGGIIDNGDNGFFSDLMHLLEFGDYYSKQERPKRMLPTANIALFRDALESVGGFNETLLVAEDVDLGWRFKKAGHEILYVPGIKVKHFGLQKWSDIVKKQIKFGGFFMRARALHPDLPLQVTRNKIAFDLMLPIYVLGSSFRSIVKPYAAKLGLRIAPMLPFVIIARLNYWRGARRELRKG